MFINAIYTIDVITLIAELLIYFTFFKNFKKHDLRKHASFPKFPSKVWMILKI